MRRILAICGGGMKGLPAAMAVDELTRLAGGDLRSVIDLFAGTSIGGILAALAATGRSGTPFFTEDGPEIFKRRWWRYWPLYGAAAIESSLQARFAGAMLADCQVPLLVTALNRTRQVPLMFKSYDCQGLPEGGKTPLWKVGRATSAAQRYFPAFNLGTDFIWDGGNIANNPALCAYVEAVKLGNAGSVKVLVLGCGEASLPVVGFPQWLQDLQLTIGLQFDTSQDEVDYQMRQLIGDNYRCLQPVFDAPVALDGAGTQSLAWLKAAGSRFINVNKDEFEWFLA